MKRLRTSQKIQTILCSAGVRKDTLPRIYTLSRSGTQTGPLVPGFLLLPYFPIGNPGAGRAQHLCQVLTGHFIALSSCSRFPLNPQMDWVKLQTYSRLHQFFMFFFFLLVSVNQGHFNLFLLKYSWFTYNVVISAVQQSDSVIHTYIYSFLNIIFHYGLL